MSPVNQHAVEKTLIAAFMPKSKKRRILEGEGVSDNHSLIVFLSILGNEFCRGAYLQESLRQAMDKNNQLNVTCLLTDEVYWHNLKGLNTSKSEEIELKQRAVELGQEFLQENLHVFLTVMQQYNPKFSIDAFNLEYCDLSISDKVRNLNYEAKFYGIPLKIVLWKEWTADDDYAAKKDEFTALAKSLPRLMDAFEETADSFARRQLKHPIDINRDMILAACSNNTEKTELLKHRSWDYLSEECFALYYLAGKRGINLIAYPGKITQAFRETQQLIITNNPTEHIGLCIRVAKPRTLAGWIEIEKKTLDAAIMHAQQDSISSTEMNSADCSGCATPSHINASPDSVSSHIPRYEDTNAAFWKSYHFFSAKSDLRRSKSYNDTTSTFFKMPIIGKENFMEKLVKQLGPEESRHFAEQMLMASRNLLLDSDDEQMTLQI